MRLSLVKVLYQRLLFVVNGVIRVVSRVRRGVVRRIRPLVTDIYANESSRSTSFYERSLDRALYSVSNKQDNENGNWNGVESSAAGVSI